MAAVTWVDLLYALFYDNVMSVENEYRLKWPTINQLWQMNQCEQLYFELSSLLIHWVALCTSYFIILLCLMPDNFTCQGESAGT
jgi:hypothetical protein